MSKTSTLTLVRNLTLLTPDEGTIDRYYTESLQEIDWCFHEAALYDVDITQATFTLPQEAVSLLAVFYNARQLDLTPINEAQSFNSLWRDTPGEPLLYLTQQETERTWRITPTPSMPSTATIGFGFGIDFPGYHVLALYTQIPPAPPDLFDLLLAYRILQREFTRESSHQDVQFADRCGMIYHILLGLLRINHA